MTPVRSLRLRLRSLLRALTIRLNRRPALNDLDRKLGKYLGYRGGFFVEAGANDGYTQSNTYFLEKELGWRGLLVEGVPSLYEQCKSRRPASIVRHCALVSRDYGKTTITMHFANLMSVVEGALKTPDQQVRHIEMGLGVQGLPASYALEVPARTLESILDECRPGGSIDFLSLDVEGYELSVLHGMNLAKYRPTYILVEARFFEEIDAFLTSQRYRVIEQLTHHDYLYRADEAPPAAGPPQTP